MNEEEKKAIEWLKATTNEYVIKSELDENIEIVLNLISKLQEENKQLKERNNYLEESDYTWHQLLKIQNKREYRSKFLKEFQAEFGKNVMPDYDEIYKRYDKQKELIKKLELDNQVLKETLYGGNVSE